MKLIQSLQPEMLSVVKQIAPGNLLHYGNWNYVIAIKQTVVRMKKAVNDIHAKDVISGGQSSLG
jgi:hypothetical protein